MLLNTSVFPLELIESSSISFFLYFTEEVAYTEYRDDPIFPATFQDGKIYYNRNPWPTLVGCIDYTQICFPELGGCRHYQAEELPKPGSSWGQSHLHLRTPPTSPSWEERPLRANHIEPTNAELTEILLSNALLGSNICSKAVLWTEYDTIAYCATSQVHNNPPICSGLPPDQWKNEVRWRFETSLAQI